MKHKECSSWAAYYVYGHPQFVLTTTTLGVVRHSLLPLWQWMPLSTIYSENSSPMKFLVEWGPIILFPALLLILAAVATILSIVSCVIQVKAKLKGNKKE